MSDAHLNLEPDSESVATPVHFDLRLSELQELARTLGLNQTAPKSALIARLKDALTNHTAPPLDARILSIDLGIRNLAYALLTPSQKPQTHPKRRSKDDEASELVPVVHAWNRVDLRSLSSIGLDHKPLPTQDYTPPSLSVLALDLVRTHLLPLNPTHVLIEKQRFRSAGGSAVLEWTVRVNSLESMLYAIFATLKSLGHFHGVVIPIDPRRVGPFLLESDRDGAETKVVATEVAGGRKNAKKGVTRGEVASRVKGAKENKKLKINLVGSWLRDGRGVDFEGESEVMKRAFLRRWLPKEKKSKADKEAAAEDEKVIEKLDDVADCLLQGVAWLQWEENKRKLVKELGDKL
ncbi:ribonuclease H-like protein [Coniochaeta sp. PMI_546]|nr:ribonuclease H-like protein [Coniochaeta sp. PMI_546]